MRLIDADELKKRAIKVCFADVPECGEFDAVGVSDIDIMPTIDPESLRPTAEWISVKDRLPDPYEKVIVYNAENDETFFARRIEIGYKRWDAVTREFVNWRWIPYGYTFITLDSVTHWIPRLKTPNETNETPSRTPTPDRIRHLAEILKTEYSDRTVTIDTLIYTLRRLADVIEEDEPPKEEP